MGAIAKCGYRLVVAALSAGIVLVGAAGGAVAAGAADAAAVDAAVAADLAAAAVAHPRVVSANPADFTPNLIDDAAAPNAAIHALAPAGGQIVAGGIFRTVQNAARTQTFTRNNIMSFSATSGALSTSFAPNVNGEVWAIQVSGNFLFIGGTFTTVNGVARRGLAKINATTGALDTAFVPSLVSSGGVTEVRLVNGRLFIGGTFPRRLAAVNPASGAVDTAYMNLAISGSVAANAGPTEVYRFAVNPARTRLVAVGNFTAVGGQPRQRAFMLDLGPTSASVNAWYYQPLDRPCAATMTPDYLRDVDFAPNGNWFVIVSTGFIPRPGEVGITVCDAAARFETATARPSRPTWINYTGGDTLQSVVVTGAAVYVQGHQRWLDNPNGDGTNAGPGAVSRIGIGAINPTTGKALAWNPGKSREVGGKDMLATAAGLWVGSDGQQFAGEARSGIAFCPL